MKRPSRSRTPEHGAEATRAPTIGPGPHTLGIDIGGTALKASVLDRNGRMIVERAPVPTPYPCSPKVLVRALAELTAALPSFDRISVGFPGVVRGGHVVTAPHFGEKAWRGYPLEATVAQRLQRPARLLNDAEVQGLGVIAGRGLEVVLTLGTGIGKEDYDPGKARYHRIILMTDADVDGSHIRTLLLTFFYRQMPELISRGYLYVAQPPLYKVTRGKKELFLKDQRALDEHLMRIGVDRCGVVSSETDGDARIQGTELRRLLEAIGQYEERLKKLARRRDPRILDALVQAARVDETTLLDMDRLNSEVEKVHGWLRERYPEVLAQLKAFRKDDPEHQAKKLVFRTEVNGSPKETVLDHAFLSSPEYGELLELRRTFDTLGPAPWTVTLEEGEKVALRVQDILAAVLADASRGLAIQRFKGLGEMNPEQLWETTMNPDSRTLLQVRVEDAVESDEIFSLLMGEAVEPRREFIEKNALDVQNLDI